jgi:uncharacterized protein YjbJ (UPF0337 family)
MIYSVSRRGGRNYQIFAPTPAMMMRQCPEFTPGISVGTAVARVFARRHFLWWPSMAEISSTEEQAMNWDRMQGNWKQMTGKVKQQWGKLTDDALMQINGQRDQLVGKIQEAYGINRDEAEKQVKDWERLN